MGLSLKSINNFALIFTAVGSALFAANSAVAEVQPKAVEMLKTSCESRSTVQSFHAKAKVQIDWLNDNDQKIQDNQVIEVMVDKKTNRLRVDRSGDINTSVYVDGETLTFADTDQEAYAQTAFNGSLADLISHADQVGVALPLVEYFSAEACLEALPLAKVAKVVNESTMGETAVTQLFFEFEKVNLQVWLKQDMGIQKLVITSTDMVNQPQYQLEVLSVEKNIEFPKSNFAFIAPAKHDKVSFLWETEVSLNSINDFSLNLSGDNGTMETLARRGRGRRGGGSRVNRGAARRPARRSPRRTARRTARRVSRRHAVLPRGCTYGVYYGAYYHHCGSRYYEAVVEGGVTVYFQVSFN